MTVTEDLVAYRVLGELYHRYNTGVQLSLSMRLGPTRAAEVSFRMMRTQQEDLFLAGLKKLGLDKLPHAVACAQYHVLSNALGGVRVVWTPESDRKSWVRYVPPRWIFDGTAVCGIPSEVSRAPMRAWHANNGVMLGNLRLGFVCTSQTTDGQPGLEGYYIEEDEPLAPEDRLRFRPGERPTRPPVDLPKPDWGETRLAKVVRNYSMAYVRRIVLAMLSVVGAADTAYVGRVAGRQIGMQYHRDIMAKLNGTDEPTSFSERFARLLRAHGDEVTVQQGTQETLVNMSGLRIFRDAVLPAEGFEAWNGLWEGFAMMEELKLIAVHTDLAAGKITWAIRPDPRA